MSIDRWLLINPNSNSETTEMMLDAARRELAHQGVQIDIVGLTARAGPARLSTESDLLIGAESVRDMVDGAKARLQPTRVIVAAFADPGIDYAERAFPGRTVGIGSSALLEAANGRSDRFEESSHGWRRTFAVVTTTPELVGAIERRVNVLELQAQWRGVFLTDDSIPELMNDPHRLVAALESATARAVQAGVDAVIVGGGPLAAAADSLTMLVRGQEFELIAPVPAAVRACIRLSS